MSRVDTARVLGLLGPLIALSFLVPQVVRGQLYRIDWANHLFLVTHQAESMRLLGHPTYFLNTDITGQLTPFYMFYGASLYALAGVLSILLTSSVAAYLILYAVGMLMTYAGACWAARLAGMSAAWSHLPALVCASGAYYLSNAYGLGHWPEYMAVSTVPVIAASATAAVRGDGAGVRPFCVLFAAVALLTGSHTITTVWGTVFLATVALALVVATWSRANRLPARRLVLAALAAGLGVGVNLWFLLPDLVYARHSFVYLGVVGGEGFNPSYNRDLGEPGPLLNPLGYTKHGGGIYVQAPVLALAWSLLVLLVVVAVRGRGSPALRRAAVALILVLGVLAVLFLFADVWSVLPALLKGIQSPERLTSYITFATAALLVTGLLAVRSAGASRGWVVAATAAVLLQVGLGERQVWGSDGAGPTGDVTAAPFAPKGDTMLHGARDYRLSMGPVVARPAARLTVDGRDLADGEATITGRRARPGLYATNVAYSPMLRVVGDAVLVGRDPDGLAVVDLRDSASAWTVTFSPQSTWATRVGLLGSALSVLAALALLVTALVRGRRGRRRGTAALA